MDKASDCIVPVHIFQCPVQAPPISASRFSTVLFQAYILLGSPKHLIKKIKTINQTIIFFFLIGNEKILLRKNQPTRVHWGCTMGAKIKNHNYNDQVKREGKNKKNTIKPHSKQGEYTRKKT